MAIVSPSILAADFMNLGRDLQDIGESGCDWIHVDIMDGLFVPNLSIGIPVVSAARKVTALPLDVHLMIDRPIRYIDEFVKAGSDWLTIHLEADTQENTILALQRIRELGCKAGLSVKPATPAEALVPFLPYCDLILVMTVEPGFGGQKFQPQMMPKLKAVKELCRQNFPEIKLSVDGGIDLTTAPVCVENGANVLVSGSAYFKSPNHEEFASQLRSLYCN